MKHLLITGAAFLALAGAASADTRNLRGFDSVNAADRIDVVVTQGQNFSVRVDGREANKVRTIVEGDELRIRQTNRPWFGGPRRVDAVVHVTMPTVEGLAASRGASLRAENINANSMSLAAAMGGEVEITGACRDLSAAASMGGLVRAGGFQCATADVAASMGGDARVFASSSLDGAASMGGSIDNYGGGQNGDVRTSMGGSVTTR